jgi:hypothetical protein
MNTLDRVKTVHEGVERLATAVRLGNDVTSGFWSVTRAGAIGAAHHSSPEEVARKCDQLAAELRASPMNR